MSCCSGQLLLKTAILKVKTGWSALSLLGMAQKPTIMWEVTGEFRLFGGHSAGAGNAKRALLAQHGAEGEVRSETKTKFRVCTQDLQV